MYAEHLLYGFLWITLQLLIFGQTRNYFSFLAGIKAQAHTYGAYYIYFRALTHCDLPNYCCFIVCVAYLL